ncbi:MAG: site-specific DNA-methyltransferase [Caldilineales bacterium]|nr:site-specific DNA-methyltransferase [Caldilineales bacterium]MCW5858730.1 site-specific DNA-methyltransferase [Caldilineales bacterium]
MASKRSPGTQTTAFGSPGRVSHDASHFYAGRLYGDQDAAEDDAPYHENPVPAGALDAVLVGDSRTMRELPDACIHLMVTSPPYNARKDYDADLTLDEYLDLLRDVLCETHRVLTPGGRACINIANLGRKPYIPLSSFVNQIMIEAGFLMRGEIIWDKGSSAGSSTAWGSWRSPSNPTIRDVHEYILIFGKGRFRRPTAGREATISRDDFLELTKSIWRFPTESATRVGHPAPFPVELPRRLIELYTCKDEIVLDPFLGSGSTAVAARQSGRHFVGYEIDPTYADLARTRIAALPRYSPSPPPDH